MSGGSPDVWKARRMYDPVKDGVEKSVLDVTYTEVTPADEQAELVHCFWPVSYTHLTLPTIYSV